MTRIARKPDDVTTRLMFCALCKQNGLPEPIPEYRFARPRRWRLDYAWPWHKVALEVEGGAWTGGRHTRGSGFVADIEKYNELAVRGWRLVRVVPKALLTSETVELLRRALSEAA